MSLPTNYDDRNLEPLRAVVIERLKQGFAEGHLEIDELERRLARASEAGTASDLGDLICDLPAEPQPAASDRQPAPFSGRQKRSVVTILGGTSRGGRWQPAPLLATYTFMAHGTVLEGKTQLARPLFRNERSVDAVLQELKERPWTVWYSPQHPERATIDKHFPMRETLVALFLLGLFVYFIGLGIYVRSRIS